MRYDAAYCGPASRTTSGAASSAGFAVSLESAVLVLPVVARVEHARVQSSVGGWDSCEEQATRSPPETAAAKTIPTTNRFGITQV